MVFQPAVGLYLCTRRECVGRREEWVDLLVERLVVRRLQRPDAVHLLRRDDAAARAARERAAALRARLDGAADSYAAGEIDRAQLMRITQQLRPQLEAAEQAAARAIRGVPPERLAELAGPRAEQRWEALTVQQRRALLDLRHRPLRS